jgi:mannose-6-phosphate isomerase-like protein (cupin superfamily)
MRSSHGSTAACETRRHSSNRSEIKVASSETPNLASTFVVVEPHHAAIPVAVTPTIYQELDERFEHFKGRLLVASFSFESDWPSWEIHPAGDEIVCLLSGDVHMVLDRNGVEEIIHLRDPGSFVIVPKGTWHTARTSVPTTMLFVTPGEGTQNKPR